MKIIMSLPITMAVVLLCNHSRVISAGEDSSTYVKVNFALEKQVYSVESPMMAVVLIENVYKNPIRIMINPPEDIGFNLVEVRSSHLDEPTNISANNGAKRRWGLVINPNETILIPLSLKRYIRDFKPDKYQITYRIHTDLLLENDHGLDFMTEGVVNIDVDDSVMDEKSIIDIINSLPNDPGLKFDPDRFSAYIQATESILWCDNAAAIPGIIELAKMDSSYADNAIRSLIRFLPLPEAKAGINIIAVQGETGSLITYFSLMRSGVIHKDEDTLKKIADARNVKNANWKLMDIYAEKDLLIYIDEILEQYIQKEN